MTPNRWLPGIAAVAAATALAACTGSAATTPDAPPAEAAAAADTGTGVGTDTAAEGMPKDRTLTPFDTGYAAIRKLDPKLLGAVQKAAKDAQNRGIRFTVTSGWRSKAYQQRLLDEAVEKYGSLSKARQYVNTPEKSTHVSGKAIDIGPTNADDWLIRHGSDYGLCQVYANEMWHFELLTTPGGECPAPLPDAAG
jgi:D-alanyl-D-alanine carboxypeptidase